MHLEHFIHDFDAGRVEAQQLVERRRFLPSREGIRSGSVGGAATAHTACKERLDWSLSAQGTRGVHTLNISFMLVTLDVSKLNDSLNAFAPCAESRGRHAMRDGRWGGGAVATHIACKGRLQGTDRVHPEHEAHVRDAGRVEAQRLVERFRVLPSRKRENRWGGGRACGVQGKARIESERREQAECTLNMVFIVVTRDVSKLSGWLNAFASCRVERRANGTAVGRAVAATCRGRLSNGVWWSAP